MTHSFSFNVFALSAVILFSFAPPAKAQRYTQEDFDSICGTKMGIKSAGSVQDYRILDRQVQQHNSKVDVCINRLIERERERERIDAIPVGETIPNKSINGVPLRKCSHGRVCLNQMMELMRQ